MNNLRQGAEITGTERLDADVVVVGSGGGGAPAAYTLARAGIPTVVLEAGPFRTPDDFNQRELEMSQKLYVDGGAQGPKSGAVAILQSEGVGGSTVVNGEVCFRTPDFVLEEWAREFGVPDMSPSEMAPVFDEVEAMIHATINEGRFLEAAKPVARGMEALGIEPKPITRNVDGCRGCAYCFWGCAYGCKQSMEQSYLPAATGLGARIYADTRVERLVLKRGAVRGVRARTAGGGTVEVQCKAIVLACGAVQTPLLLQAHGLGGKEVGRHFAVHPVLFTTGAFPEQKPAAPATMLSMYTDAFLEKDGFLVEVGTGSVPFGAAGVPGFGQAHKEAVRDMGPRSMGGGAILRDRHGPGRVRRDRRGRKIIEYELDEPTRAICRTAMKRCAEVLFAGGAEQVWFSTVAPTFLTSPDELDAVDDLRLDAPDLYLFSYHPQGTARLGAVTDHDGQVRGTRGLYVMDTSLFPTPTGVNPQVSVMAVSTVLARKLAAALRV